MSECFNNCQPSIEYQDFIDSLRSISRYSSQDITVKAVYDDMRKKGKSVVKLQQFMKEGRITFLF